MNTSNCYLFIFPFSAQYIMNFQKPEHWNNSIPPETHNNVFFEIHIKNRPITSILQVFEIFLYRPSLGSPQSRSLLMGRYIKVFRTNEYQEHNIIRSFYSGVRYGIPVFTAISELMLAGPHLGPLWSPFCVQMYFFGLMFYCLFLLLIFSFGYNKRLRLCL